MSQVFCHNDGARLEGGRCSVCGAISWESEKANERIWVEATRRAVERKGESRMDVVRHLGGFAGRKP